MYASSQYQTAPLSISISPSFHRPSYSRLETMAHSEYESSPGIRYSIRSFPVPQPYSIASTVSTAFSAPSNSFWYSSTSEQRGYAPSSPINYSILASPHTEYHFHPEEFLKPGKEGRFIGQAEEIRKYVLDAFQKIFETPFPNNIHLTVCKEKEFRKIAPHPGTIGLSINRGREGLISEIFVLNDSLARVMLTIGHELGHVLTETLPNPQDEEAKAYAFSLVWMKTIKEHDIAGLAEAIVTERPAENGLHNVAFGWVERLLHAGKEVGEIYAGLVRRILSVNTPLFMD